MNKLSRGEIVRAILMILVGTTLIVTIAAVPNLALTMKLLPRSVRKRFILQSIQRMKAKGLLQVETVGKEKRIVLTKDGKRRAELESLTLPKYGHSLIDGSWFVVTFDIPETKKSARKALSRKLQELGFLQFQKSNYVYPRSCIPEIETIRNYFQVKKHITYFRVLHFEPEMEQRLRKHFAIKK